MTYLKLKLYFIWRASLPIIKYCLPFSRSALAHVAFLMKVTSESFWATASPERHTHVRLSHSCYNVTIINSQNSSTSWLFTQEYMFISSGNWKVTMSIWLRLWNLESGSLGQTSALLLAGCVDPDKWGSGPSSERWEWRWNPPWETDVRLNGLTYIWKVIRTQQVLYKCLLL